MITRKWNRLIVFGSVLLLSSFVGATSGMAASKPTPKPAPAPAPKPSPAPAQVPLPIVAVVPVPVPSPQPAPSPKPAAPSAASQVTSNPAGNQSGILKTALDNPIGEAISVIVANRATLTPTFIQGPASVIENIGGLAQVVPTMVTVAKSSGPTILAIVATLARGAAYG
jgi:hypothetical protein